MGEHEGVATVEVGGDLLGVDRAHHLVGHQHHDDVGRSDRLGHGEDLEPGLGGGCGAGRVGTKTDHDIDSGFGEVAGMGVALAAETDDGHLVLLDQIGIAVAVVVDVRHVADCCRLRRTRPNGALGSRS